MCVFCEIVKGNIPSKKIYEDDNTIAILDLSQATYGHTLIIPKKHSSNVLEIDDESYVNAMKVAKKVASAIKKSFDDVLGFNLLNNCGEDAGQTVNHFHIHIIPRYKNDGIKIEFVDNQGKFDMEEIKNKIIKNI